MLVRCYHGLGDTAQFIRYAEPLRAVAAEVIVWAQPSLCDLVATAAGVDRVLPLHDGTPDVAYDVDVEVMELPHLFRTAVETVPDRVPYLHADQGERLSDRFAVGVVWRAGDWDDRRPVPAAMLAAAVADVPGVDWFSLQQGPGAADRPAAFAPVAESATPTGTARVMRSLDLVLGSPGAAAGTPAAG